MNISKKINRRKFSLILGGALTIGVAASGIASADGHSMLKSPYGEGDMATPFGGYKMSGFGGRDNGTDAHEQYTETKTIWVDLSDPADGDEIA